MIQSRRGIAPHATLMLAVSLLLRTAVVCAPAAGAFATTAARPTGTIRSTVVAGSPNAWGLNNRGQLGTGTLAYSNIPLSVHGLTDVVQLAAGDDFSLALRRDGTVWAWGMDEWGQLGQPAPSCGIAHATYTCSLVPRRVPGLSHVTAIAAAIGTPDGFSLALKQDGTVWGWGGTGWGQIGPDESHDCHAAQMGGGTCRKQPAPLAGLRHVVAIAAAFDTSMALEADGSIWMAGSVIGNNVGWQPGDPPKRVQRFPGARTIAVCDNYSLVLTKDGTVWAWGDDQDGGLGSDQNPGTDHARPAPVQHLTQASAIACSFGSSFALRRDGTVWAWGWNVDGTLGRGIANGQYRTDLPQQVPSLRHVIALASGTFHVLALTREGQVWAWGDNSAGELGIGTSGGINTEPVRVRGLAHVSAIAAGARFSLATQQTGSH